MLAEYDEEKVKLEAKIDKLEDKRSAIASKLTTIDSLPELAKDRASIKEKQHQVCLLQGNRRCQKSRLKIDKGIEKIEEEYRSSIS